ncbi:MAG: radical SAM protein [Pirellulaceae bacterium]|nr:radical SAM protein [Pirellulaceae bacterium]
MIIKGKSLDVLLITDEHTEDEDQSFITNKDMIREGETFFSQSVKDKLDGLHARNSLLFPVEMDGEQVFQIRLPHRPSLALCDLATVIDRAGYSVCVLDNVRTLPWRYEQLRSIIQQKSPRVIGISTTFLMVSSYIKQLVKKLREMAPDAKIILGGQTVRELSELHDCADFAVFGEGEVAMLAILKSLDGDRDPSTIPNIAFLDDEGQLQYGSSIEQGIMVEVPGKPFKARVDEEIPIADWSLYGRNRDGVYSIEFSRGCKYNCFYCTYDRGMNLRSLDSIRTELVRNAEMGITKYRVADANFTDGPGRYKRYPHDICQLMIDLDLGLQWSCYSRVDDMTDELADLLMRAGCFGVFFGVESGDDRILKLMRKGHDVADSYKGIAIAQKHGLFVHSNFLVGYPGETRESYGNTLDFIERSRPDTVTLGIFFLPLRAPVNGPQFKDYELDGFGLNWRHATMDSDTARRLVAEGTSYLVDQGLVFGNEFEFQGMMSVGFSANDVQGILKSRSHKRRSGLAVRKVADHCPSWLMKMAEQNGRDVREMELVIS